MTDNITELKPAKNPKDVLKQIESEAKDQQFKEFKSKVQEIMKEKQAAEKIIRQADAKIDDLMAKYEKGIL